MVSNKGEAVKSDQVFYAGIFEDKECTKLSDKVAQNIVQLRLDGNSEVTTSTKVYFNEDEEVTLYVAEVDPNGKLVSEIDSFTYEVTIDKNEVHFNTNTLNQSVTIMNQEKPEKPKNPKTGYQTSSGTFALLAIGSMAVLMYLFRKKKYNA